MAKASEIKTNDSSNEDVEGLDDAETSGWADYPLDSVFVRKEERSVSEAVKRIRNGRYLLHPDFQRDFVWPEKKQSKLIESCIMRIPLPAFYVAENADGRIVVVDGLQRLTTFFRFLDNKFFLTGLAPTQGGEKHQFEGKYFKDLPINLQERIEDTPLLLYILDAKAPERAKLDIFDRVNSGVALSRQQMRNSLYNGKATNWLKQSSNSKLFLQATGASLNRLTMRDREAINRFCAFKLLGYKSYQGGDMDHFLGQSLEKMNKLSEAQLSQLQVDFESSMRINYRLFGAHAFRKSLREVDENARRSVVNIALFDVMSVFFSDVDDDIEDDLVTDIVYSAVELLDDADFSVAITYSTNSTNAVRTRFEMLEETFGEYFK